MGGFTTLLLQMALIACARSALGYAVSMEIGAPTFVGKGCESPDDVSAALSADGKWLRVNFPTAFVAESGEQYTHTRVACNGVIPVDVPTGYAVGISKDALEGFVSIPSSSDAAAGSYAQVTSEFFFVSQRRGQKLKQRFSTPGATRFSVDASSETIWSPCGARHASLRVNTALIAHGNASSIGFGSSGDGGGSKALRFAVSYRKCAGAGEEDAETVDEEQQEPEEDDQ